MTAQITDVEKIRHLPWMVTASVFNVAFVSLTFAGSVFILFLAELNLDNGQIGVLLSLIPFCGIVAPFVAPLVTRYGYKRAFVTFWGIRKFVIALLLLTPWFQSRFGVAYTFYWVAGIIFGFALCRAIAETGGFPWRKEVVPDSIRGKFSAINSMSTTVAGIIVVTSASFVIDSGDGLGRFINLIAVGIAFGLLSVYAFSRVPAESGSRQVEARSGHLQGMQHALRDRRFVTFMLALGLATLGGTSVISFVPLYMRQQVGLRDGNIVLLSIGTYIGALLTSYLWGWAADRYGSKPVMQFSLYLMLILPVSWFLMPKQSDMSAPIAMAIAFVTGVANLAWQISWTRYLFVNATPQRERGPYMAVYYAWFSLVSGMGPLLAGQLLELTGGIRADLGPLHLGPYTPLFILSVGLLLAGGFTVSRLPADGRTSFKRFAGMFLRGNPVRALSLLVQYNFAGSEMTRMTTAERLGATGNPLSSKELIEALSDPSFNVRYEAINAIGHLPPEPELVQALITVLEGTESEMCVAAARALGKLGDKRAIPALRKTLYSGYRLLEANSARALAMLDDTAGVPHFREKLEQESNTALRVAYISALGKLGAVEAIDDLFELLRQAEPEVLRGEIGLALARIAGDERYYLQHWRSMRANFNTVTAQSILALQKQARHLEITAFEPLVERCAEHFAQGDRATGVEALKTVINRVRVENADPHVAAVLQGCAEGLTQFGDSRFEYILLSLHTLDVALRNGHEGGQTSWFGSRRDATVRQSL